MNQPRCQMRLYDQDCTSRVCNGLAVSIWKSKERSTPVCEQHETMIQDCAKGGTIAAVFEPTFTELCPGVRNGFEIAIVTAGQLRAGDILPEHIVARKPVRPRKEIEGQTYRKLHRARMADGLCVRCGDQAMGILCDPCARKNAQAQQDRIDDRRILEGR